MWGWFGGGAAAQKRKDGPKNAILGLRSQLDMLQKREKYLNTQIEEQEAIARKNVNTNKNGTFLECTVMERQCGADMDDNSGQGGFEAKEDA